MRVCTLVAWAAWHSRIAFIDSCEVLLMCFKSLLVQFAEISFRSVFGMNELSACPWVIYLPSQRVVGMDRNEFRDMDTAHPHIHCMILYSMIHLYTALEGKERWVGTWIPTRDKA
jgi:hypothetical protein